MSWSYYILFTRDKHSNGSGIFENAYEIKYYNI
jgi:hypothetical protein